MAIPQMRAVGGGSELTFFPPISGHPDESGRFGGWGERGYNEEAEKQSKMRSHFSSKEGCRDANNPGRHP